jgi:hypothetical protein
MLYDQPDHRIERLTAVRREVERLKREEEGSAPREALSKAAIEALAERLTHFDTPRSL